jgi:hypothetical protein
MFQDLDATLKQMLTDAAAPSPLRGAEVSFLTPDKNFPPTLTGATVNLFLYEVRENRELRDPTPILERVGENFIRRTPPLRVDCSYIVTTWSNGTGELKVSAEHQLLAQALMRLSRFSVIPPDFLQGSLKTPPQLYPPPTMVAQIDPNKNAGEFWDALAIPPRPAFYLTVTIAMDLNLTEEGALVTTRSTRFKEETLGQTGEETWVQVGGQVQTGTGPNLQNIANATVDILDAGLRATSDADGRYSFPRVPSGTRKFRVVAVGFQVLEKSLQVPGLPEDYVMILTPF